MIKNKSQRRDKSLRKTLMIRNKPIVILLYFYISLVEEI
jgi:hypothetical protein